MHTRVEFLLKRKGVCPFFFSDFFSRHTPFLPQKISQISLYWAFVVDFFCFFSSRSIHHHTSLGVCIFAPFFLVVWKGCVIIFEKRSGKAKYTAHRRTLAVGEAFEETTFSLSLSLSLSSRVLKK